MNRRLKVVLFSTHGEPREECESQGGDFFPSFFAGEERSEAEDANLRTALAHLSKIALTNETPERAEAEARAARAASALPCLSKTTALKEESPPLPGPRRKQAQALTDNIKWMVEAFGKERIGFLTLTLGDFDAGGSRVARRLDVDVDKQRGRCAGHEPGGANAPRFR